MNRKAAKTETWGPRVRGQVEEALAKQIRKELVAERHGPFFGKQVKVVFHEGRSESRFQRFSETLAISHRLVTCLVYLRKINSMCANMNTYSHLLFGEMGQGVNASKSCFG